MCVVDVSVTENFSSQFSHVINTKDAIDLTNTTKLKVVIGLYVRAQKILAAKMLWDLPP